MDNMQINFIIGDRIFVKRDLKETTKAGVYLPENMRDIENTGTIVAVGKGTKDNPMLVSKGQRVMFEKHCKNVVKIEDEEYLVLRQGEIICVLK